MLCWKKNKELQTSSHSFNPPLPWIARIARNTRIGRMPTTIHINVDKKNSAIHANDNKWHYSNNSCPVSHKLLANCTKKKSWSKKRTDPQRYIPWETERQRRKSEHPPLLPELAREAPDIPEIETKSLRELQFPWQQISHARRGGDQGRPERERAPCCRAWCPTHPCHCYSHYQSSKLSKSNRTPQIAPPSSHFTSANPPFPSSHRMPQIFRTRFPTRRRRNRISIGRKLRESLRRARKFARSDVDQTLANPNAT